MTESFKKDFIDKIPMAYAYHKMIFDDMGKPIDYEFVDVNDAFEKQTLLKRTNILGKKVTEVIPGIAENSFDWIKTYGEVVTEKKTLEFDEFSEDIGKWFHIFTYSPNEGYFITMFFDISEAVKKSEEQLAMYTVLNDIIIELDENYLVQNLLAPNEDAALFYSKEETIGVDLVKQLPGEHSNILRDLLEKTKKSGKMETTYYNSVFKGDRRWFQSDAKYVEINKKSRYVIAVREITEKKILEKKLSDSEILFRTIFEQAPIGIAIAKDYKLIANINSEFQRILGRTAEEIELLSWTEITHPDDIEEDLELFKKFKDGEIPNYTMVKRYLRKDGTAIWVNMIVAHLKLDSDLSKQDNHICIVRDIDDSVKAELALKESERSKAVVLSHIPGMAYRCKVDRAWTMEFISEGCYDLTGYKPEQIIDNKEISFNEIICPEYREYLWENWSFDIENEKIFREEYQITTADGSKKWVLEQGQPIYDENNKPVAIEGLIIDISQSKKRELKIIYMNDHDTLTDLYNRRYFFEELKKSDAIKGLPISIIVGNINGIRLINNAFGVEFGDSLIEETSKIMRKYCKETFTLARIGGDDFGILLPNTDFKVALEITDKIKEECENFSKKIGNQSFNINISFGCGTKNNMDEKLLDIYTMAQDYMYKSKLLERKSSHGDILSAIMATLFAKSQETENHAQRLLDISKKIGIEFGFLKHDLDLIELLAMLHDIGKIGIDDQILNKPGKLSEDEWKIMKKHPEIGYKIAISSPELEPIAEFILTHHERWDGEGYPNGLKGEDISLISRIIAVADAYDAMTEERIYRKAISHDKAVEEINRCSGTQFDPGVVKVFNEVIKSVI